MLPTSGLHRREAIPIRRKEALVTSSGFVVCLAGPTKDEGTSSMRRSASKQESSLGDCASIEVNEQFFSIRWSQYETR